MKTKQAPTAPANAVVLLSRRQLFKRIKALRVIVYPYNIVSGMSRSRLRHEATNYDQLVSEIDELTADAADIQDAIQQLRTTCEMAAKAAKSAATSPPPKHPARTPTAGRNCPTSAKRTCPPSASTEFPRP